MSEQLIERQAVEVIGLLAVNGGDVRRGLVY